MIRKDAGKFPRLLALTYIVAQILGASAGALVSWSFSVISGVYIKQSSRMIFRGGHILEGNSLHEEVIHARVQHESLEEDVPHNEEELDWH